MPELPRGIRNDNPMNIRITSAPWLGKVSPNTDGEFEQFSDPKYGIRAGAIVLMNYQAVDGLETLRGYINRWSPPTENNTDAYLDAVCQALDCNPDDPYNLTDLTRLSTLVVAIIHQEQGCVPYDPNVIQGGVTMALPASATIIPFPKT